MVIFEYCFKNNIFPLFFALTFTKHQKKIFILFPLHHEKLFLIECLPNRKAASAK